MKGVHIFGAKRDTEESAKKAQAIVEAIAKNTAAQVCLDILGPMAQTFAEFMERQTTLEDALWYCANCRVTTLGEAGSCPVCGTGVRIQYRYVQKETGEGAAGGGIPSAGLSGPARPETADRETAAGAAPELATAGMASAGDEEC